MDDSIRCACQLYFISSMSKKLDRPFVSVAVTLEALMITRLWPFSCNRINFYFFTFSYLLSIF